MTKQAKKQLNRLSRGPLPRRVSIRKTNPNLYLSVMMFALTNVALGFNFLLTTPTFLQFDIPKNAIGWTFMILGISLIVFLNFWRNLKIVRALLIASVAFYLFWGIGTSQTFFQGKSSLQLLILYFGMAFRLIPLILEPFTNPVTDKTNGAK